MPFYPELTDAFLEMVDSLGQERVAVLGHARPDGDCIGSQMALCRLLQSQGREAFALNSDPIPEALSFLASGFDLEDLNKYPLPDNMPLLFVDCADEKRVGVAASALIENRSYHANIDHHISNTEYARFNVVETESAATCEILAGLAFDLGWEIDSQTAQALLTGIMTDTGRYGYVATSKRVFELSGMLVDCGARPHLTAQSLYENEPFSRLMLLQRFLGTLRVEFDGRLGVGKLYRKDFEETGGTQEQTEGFVDYTRSIRGAKIGLYLEERFTTVKGSLRAESPDYRVDQIAKYFGGGGHACAAAFSTDFPIENVEEAVMEKIRQRLDEVER